MMHNRGALLQVLNSLRVLLPINVEDTPIKIKVFLVKDILLVVVCIIVSLLLFR